MFFRLLLGTALPAATVDLCADETCHQTESATMLQTAGRSTTGTGTGSRSGQAAGLYAATVKLLKEGATPEVVTFSEKAVQDIETTVYDAMDSAHQADQALLDGLLENFEKIRGDYQESIRELLSFGAKVDQESKTHSDCRDLEQQKCNKYHEEEEKRKTRWEEFTTADTEFTARTDEQQWCGDSETDMEAQHARFEHYETSGKTRFDAWDAHETQRIITLQHLQELEAQSAICRSDQTRFERTSCERYSKWEAAKGSMTEEWTLALRDYTITKHDVEKKTADRNAEFSTLEEVKCLLSDIRERGGRPCEEQQDGSPDEAAQIIDDCRNHTKSNKYTIRYPSTGNMPDLLAEPTKPCDEKFIADEYSHYKNDTKCFENFPACEPCTGVV